jgi:formimidoylglutamate deiminase
MGRAVLEAAAGAGIRLVFLHTAYMAGGFDLPLEETQRRFATPDLGAFWAAADRLSAGMGVHQTLGIAAHSVRAVPPKELTALYAEARRRGLVFHLHAEEQDAEVEGAVATLGSAPIDFLVEQLAADATLTAVHGTRSTAERLERLLGTGANLCVCPLTEANLGDGLVPIAAEDGTGGLADRYPEQICLGTDSNARISMLEEARWLELGQRLRTGRRGALGDRTGNVASRLLDAATAGGARALGIPAGDIAVGKWADFALVDLTSPSLRGIGNEDLAAALVLGSGDDVIAGTCVGGRWRHR